YDYQTTFDLTGFDPATVRLVGNWAVDDSGTDIKINGASSGVKNTAAFSIYSPFVITSGFKTGLNTIDFIVNNGDNGNPTNPTGLRVDGLRAGAKRPSEQGPSLVISKSGGNNTVSWPTSHAGY